MAEVKACALCEHCTFDPGFGGSEVTAADPAGFDCEMLVFTGERDLTDIDLHKTAMDCQHFQLKTEIVQMLEARENR